MLAQLDIVRSCKMENVTTYTIVEPFSNVSNEYVEIDNGDGNKTYMLKSTYDEQQANLATATDFILPTE
jgi:hypothetical protein